MSDNFESTFKIFCGTAPVIFDNDGYCAGVLLAGRGDICTEPIPMVWGNEAEKTRLYDDLRIGLQNHVDWYVHVAEGWVLIKPLDDTIGALRPSLNPERGEKLIVMGRHVDGRTLYRSWTIIRPKVGKPSLRLDEESTELGWSLLDEVVLGIQNPAKVVIDNDILTWGDI